MTKLQKQMLRNYLIGVSIILLLISIVLTFALDWKPGVYFLLGVTLLFALFMLAGVIYVSVAAEIYEWRIRGCIEPEELSVWDEWKHLITSADCEYVIRICKEDDEHLADVPILEKIAKAKRPRWY